ncbi:hypothetical protein Q3O60_08305 [Alkalimonas collagenimarina]|uniref:Phage abortive infection protein n=1 Tax=Alkalimonas collagenimarina TaxID=400390 RepID=A0ABT9GYQ7_9GAMM|nr:hypothetical protein [Alkalimonas collagenimarina]MDP4536186.1 hypothetical protein [Alkalimonas collagenimarina]
MKKFEHRAWVIDPQLGLHQHAIFWVPVIFFVFLALILSLPLWCWCAPLSLDYEQIMKDATYPIFVASLAIPVGVMVGRFHGSAQRKLSNELSNSGMNFNRFYEHRKHFYDFITENYKPSDQIVRMVYVAYKANLYRILFPKNTPERNYFEMDCAEFKSKISVIRNKIQDSITRFQVKHSNSESVTFEEALSFIDDILKHFGLAAAKDFQEELSNSDQNSVFGLLLLCIKGSLKEAFQFAETDLLSKLGWHFHLSLEECFTGYKSDKEALELNEKLLRAISIY